MNKGFLYKWLYLVCRSSIFSQVSIILMAKLLAVYSYMFNGIEIWWIWGPIHQNIHLILLQPCHCKPSSMPTSIVLHKDWFNTLFLQFLSKIKQSKVQSPNICWRGGERSFFGGGGWGPWAVFSTVQSVRLWGRTGRTMARSPSFLGC